MQTQPSPSPQFGRDVRFSLFARGLYLITRIALPPLVLQHVALADYGLWSIAFILVSYLGLSASGFTSVYVRRSALAFQVGDVAAISRLISTGILCLSALSVVLLSTLWLMLPQLLAALGSPPERLALTRSLLTGCSAVFLADVSFGAYAYVLQGIGRIRSEQKIWVAAYLTELLVAALLLAAGAGIYSLLVAFGLRYVLSIGAAMACAHRALPGLQLHPALFDRAVIREFSGFGMVVQASAFCATALHSVERVLAGSLLGAGATALFELGNKLPSTVNSLPSAISGVTLPAASRQQSAAERVALHERATRLTALLTSLPMPALTCFALPICQFWLGTHPQIVDIAAIMTLLTPACHLHILTGPGTAIFRGAGSAANEFVYHGLRVFCLALAVLWQWPAITHSVTALASAIGVGSCVAALMYLLWNQHRLDQPIGRLLTRQLWPALSAYSAALLTQLCWTGLFLWPSHATRQTLALPLLGALCLYGVLAALSVYAFALSANEREQLGGVLLRLCPPPIRQWRNQS